jgi:hypothetical protein
MLIYGIKVQVTLYRAIRSDGDALFSFRAVGRGGDAL